MFTADPLSAPCLNCCNSADRSLTDPNPILEPLNPVPSFSGPPTTEARLACIWARRFGREYELPARKVGGQEEEAFEAARGLWAEGKLRTCWMRERDETDAISEWSEGECSRLVPGYLLE